MDEAKERTWARLGAEDGQTLTELLVALMIGLIVAAGAMTLLQIIVRSQPESRERSAHIQQGRAMLERITRELRQGEAVQVATSSELTLTTYARSAGCTWTGSPAPRAVTYSCEGGSCTRAVAGGPSELLVSGLRTDDVFRYCEADLLMDCEAQPTAANPGYVEVELAYPRTDGGEAVTVRDGVYLRNLVENDPEAPQA